MKSEGGCDFINVSVSVRMCLGYAVAINIPRIFMAENKGLFLSHTISIMGQLWVLLSFRNLVACYARGEKMVE